MQVTVLTEHFRVKSSPVNNDATTVLQTGPVPGKQGPWCPCYWSLGDGRDIDGDEILREGGDSRKLRGMADQEWRRTGGDGQEGVHLCHCREHLGSAVAHGGPWPLLRGHLAGCTP